MKAATSPGKTSSAGKTGQQEIGSPARLLAKKLLHYPSQHFGKPSRQRRKAQSVDGTFAISAQVGSELRGNGRSPVDHLVASTDTACRQTQLKTLLEELELRMKDLTNERDKLQARACSSPTDEQNARQLDLMADLQSTKEILAADLSEQKRRNADQLSAIEEIVASAIKSKDIAEKRLSAIEAQLIVLQDSNALLQLNYDRLIEKHTSDREAFRKSTIALQEKVLLLRNQTATNRRASRMSMSYILPQTVARSKETKTRSIELFALEEDVELVERLISWLRNKENEMTLDVQLGYVPLWSLRTALDQDLDVNLADSVMPLKAFVGVWYATFDETRREAMDSFRRQHGGICIGILPVEGNIPPTFKPSDSEVDIIFRVSASDYNLSDRCNDDALEQLILAIDQK